jgi:hypothetical protein
VSPEVGKLSFQLIFLQRICRWVLLSSSGFWFTFISTVSIFFTLSVTYVGGNKACNLIGWRWQVPV